MAPRTVNASRRKTDPDPVAAVSVGGPHAPRYATLAQVLSADIEAGRYPVGSLLPTEAQLQALHEVSRHTVREALRALKARGLVVSRAGIGTTVRASTPADRFVNGVGTLQDLLQFFGATRMRTLGRRVIVTDAASAEALGVGPGQQWHVAGVLRFHGGTDLPVAWTEIHVRPEHASVLDDVDTSDVPVFSLLERRHGVGVAEVRQRIVATRLGRVAARDLGARAGASALAITRRFLDARGRVVMVSAGVYPADRFVHETRFRVGEP